MRLNRARVKDMLLVLAAGVSVAGYMNLVAYLEPASVPQLAAASQEAPAQPRLLSCVCFEGGD